jgi:hypothetical protein
LRGVCQIVLSKKAVITSIAVVAPNKNSIPTAGVVRNKNSLQSIVMKARAGQLQKSPVKLNMLIGKKSGVLDLELCHRVRKTIIIENAELVPVFAVKNNVIEIAVHVDFVQESTL